MKDTFMQGPGRGEAVPFAATASETLRGLFFQKQMEYLPLSRYSIFFILLLKVLSDQLFLQR